MTEEIAPPTAKISEDNLLEYTGEFILSLMQAFLRTGYYLSGHPEARKAKTGLFEKFSAIAGKTGEITFLIADENGHRNIVVEGIDEKPRRLQDLMLRGMAETYTPRFITFLDRKDLLSLSLNSRMQSDEFSHFIDVMSEPSMTDMGGASAKANFANTLRERGIHNLSFVFREDFITAREKLPWRTRMALSRLKKDVHMIPVFRDLDEEELHRVKMQILNDILRPLGVPELAYSFLINLDLATSAAMSEDDAEDAVFSLINDKLMIALSVLFIKDIAGKTSGFPEHVTTDKKSRMLGKLCQALHHSHELQAGFILEKMFNLGFIPIEKLPDSLRIRVLTIKRMTNYLLSKNKLLDSFDKTIEPDIYAPRAQSMSSIVPYLVEGDKFEEAVNIVIMIAGHSQEKSNRAECAKQILSSIAEGTTLSLAASAFLTTPKETRSVIGQLFLLLGQASFPHLHRILVESDDIWRGKQAVDLLLSMGSEAAFTLIQLIEQNKLPSDSIPLAIRQLGDVSEGSLRLSAIQVVERMIDDAHPNTRREALSALIRLQPTGRFTLFSSKVSDPELRVRKAAIRGIGMTGETRAFEYLTRFIETAEKNGREEDYEMASLAIESLGNLKESCRDVHGKVSEYLTQLVDRICPSGTWKKLISGTLGFPPPVAITLAETLGRHAEPGTEELLTRLASHRDPAVAKRAEGILRTITGKRIPAD